MLIVLYSVQIGFGLVLAFAGGFAFTFTPLTWRAILAAPIVPACVQARGPPSRSTYPTPSPVRRAFSHKPPLFLLTTLVRPFFG